LASVSGVWVVGDPSQIESSEIILWDLMTGKEIAKLGGHTNRIFGVAFSPDGKLLATASWDKTVRIWRGLSLRGSTGPVSEKALAGLWEQLASDNASKRYDAVETFAGAPREAVSYLDKQLRAAKRVDGDDKRIATLIKQLDDASFSVRDKAADLLAAFGNAARSQLQEAVAKETSAEVVNRSKSLLAKLTSGELSVDQKRLQLAVTALSLSASPEAVRTLEDLADGSAGAWLAFEARSCLDRLGVGKK